MDVKEHLNQIIELRQSINSMIDRINELRELSTSPGAANYTNTKVQTTRNNDKIGSYVAEIVDLENKVFDQVNKLIDLLKDTIKKIDILEDDQKLILWMRYLNGKTWDEIAERMNMTLSNLHRIKNKALIEFEKLRVRNL